MLAAPGYYRDPGPAERPDETIVQGRFAGRGGRVRARAPVASPTDDLKAWDTSSRRAGCGLYPQESDVAPANVTRGRSTVVPTTGEAG